MKGKFLSMKYEITHLLSIDNLTSFSSDIQNGIKETRSKKIEIFAVLILLVLACVTRLINIDHNLNLDEIGQVLIGQESLWNSILKASTHSASTPLDYVITHFSLYTGRSSGILRLPSLVWGILTIYSVYFVGREFFGKFTGYTAAVFVTLSPLHFQYSRIIRFYSLATLLTLLSIYFLMKAIKKPTKLQWFLFGFFHLLALYSHYYALIITLICGIWIFICLLKREVGKSQFFTFLFISVGNILLFLPWIYYDIILFGHGSPVQFSVLRPITFSTLPQLFKFIFNNISSVLGSIIGGTVVLNKLNWGSLWILMIWLFSFLSFFLRFLPKRNYSLLLFNLIPFLTIPIILVLDYWAYDFGARQLLIVHPFILLTASEGLIFFFSQALRYTSNKTKISTTFGLAVILPAIFAFSVRAVNPHLFANVKGERRLKELSTWLQRYVRETDIIATDDPRFIYYYTPDLNSQVFPLWQREYWDITILSDRLTELSSRYTRVWIIPTFSTFQQVFSSWIDINRPVNLDGYFGFNISFYFYSTSVSEADLYGELFNRDPMRPLELLVSNGKIDNAFRLAKMMINSDTMTDRQKQIVKIYGGRLFTDIGEETKSIEILKELPSDDPILRAEELANLGYNYSREQNISAAISAYEEALELNPDHYWAAHLLAKVYSYQNKWEEVIRLEEHAVYLAPDENLTMESLRLLEKGYSKSDSVDSICLVIDKLLLSNESLEIQTKAESLGCRGQ